MMFYFVILIFIFILQAVKPMDMMMKSSDKYGAYNVKSIDVEMCHGPKAMDQAEISCKISNSTDDIIMGIFEIIVSEIVKVEEVKIMVYNLKNGKKNLMWNYKLGDPCKHFAVGAIFAQHLKAEKCVIKPGKYNFEINFSEIVDRFFGKSFFYGDYFFKTVALAKKGNIGCMIFHQVFEKKAGN